MYLFELCGSWMEPPFWRSAFVIEDPNDLRRVIESGIHEVWIDSSTGLDGVSGCDKPAADAAIERQLIEVAFLDHGRVVRTSMRDEVGRAARICAEGRRQVARMFEEVRMGRAIAASDALPLVEKISRSVQRNSVALISLARLKTLDDYTYMHSLVVCALMIAVARQFGLDAGQTREAGLAGLLHDIVKCHPVEGHCKLLAAPGVGAVPLDVCLHHHEKIDGSGYPERLAGASISLLARMRGGLRRL